MITSFRTKNRVKKSQEQKGQPYSSCEGNRLEEIQKKAYELYENRGYIHGRDLDDWLEAERVINEEKG